jgi:hypothetical protein
MFVKKDRDEMSNHYRGPSINASYQVSIHLAEGFQKRRLKCEKLTDDRRWTPSDGKSSHCLWQGELMTTTCLQENIEYISKAYDNVLLLLLPGKEPDSLIECICFPLLLIF